ncbi:MAG: hypothetical protein ACYTFI_19220 [Planctomycetota bacterium]
MKTTALVLAAVPGNESWTPGRRAAFSAALLAAAIAIAAVLLLVRAWMRRTGAGRAPCPGCGTFLVPGEECPNCPSRASGSLKRPDDASSRRPAGPEHPGARSGHAAGTSGSARAAPTGAEGTK